MQEEVSEFPILFIRPDCSGCDKLLKHKNLPKGLHIINVTDAATMAEAAFHNVNQYPVLVEEDETRTEGDVEDILMRLIIIGKGEPQ